VCLEILAKAKLVLTNEQFEELTFFAAERLREKEFPDREEKLGYHKKDSHVPTF
jgi:dsDNA-binding SOS-regulon protein